MAEIGRGGGGYLSLNICFHRKTWKHFKKVTETNVSRSSVAKKRKEKKEAPANQIKLKTFSNFERPSI